jgi:hypothetical protein
MCARDQRNSDLLLLLGQAELHNAALSTPADAVRHSSLAAAAFERAGRRCAMLRGVLEPLPQAQQR